MVFRKEAFQGYSFLGMYGVKTIAERFVRGEGKSLPIRAVFDREQTSGTFHSIPICPIEDAVRDGMDGLILACGVKAIPFVYARVKALCQENGIRIFDVYGHDLDVVFSCKLWDYSAADKADRDVLYREIERHDVISFDIFDTLLIRLVLQPSDAFTLVAKRARENGIRIPDVPPFKAARSIAEFRALDRKKHTLDQIYQELQTLYSWSDEECQKVRDIELQVEEQILRPRAAVVDAFQYAKKLGKRICLTTDMYLPESFLSRILSKYQITGYQKMFISGYERYSKSEGLHEFVKCQMGEGRYLHIGDNLQADGIYARYAGMDAYCLPNMAARWKLHHGDEVFLFQSYNSCSALGCALAQCFQNPFLSEEEQLENIDIWAYAYLFVAPMVSAYVFYNGTMN